MNEAQMKAFMNGAGDAAELAAGRPEPRQLDKATTQGDAPPTAVAPDRRGVYAWVSRDGHAALVHVNTRPTDHSPGGVLNASVIKSTKFYDGCAVEHWGKDGRWLLLHAFDEALAPTQPSAALTIAPAESSSGFALVPLEPTDAMTWAGQQARYPTSNSITVIYKAMLAAAPAETPPAAGAIDAREQEVKS